MSLRRVILQGFGLLIIKWKKNHASYLRELLRVFREKIASVCSKMPTSSHFSSGRCYCRRGALMGMALTGLKETQGAYSRLEDKDQHT